MTDPHDQIAAIEEQIEQLADAAERCRKFILAGKIAIAAGALWFFALLTGLAAGPAAFIGATAALIGGIVAVGTNKATRGDLLESVATAERSRAALIESMTLRPVAAQDKPLSIAPD